MSSVPADRRQRLLANIIRLRQAERQAPHVREIVAVSAELEGELGDTVSQRLAASTLGVSHTALARWIKSGDVPTVTTATGRRDVPITALLDLYERVSDERRAGRKHVLEHAVRAAEQRARHMRPEDLVAPGCGNPHDRARRRSLAYHRALARQLRRSMIDDARHVIWKWREQGKIDERYAQRWEELLYRPVADVRRAISAEGPDADDLRQNSPFAGMLSEPERRRIIGAVR
jgi:hypothetical protein